MISKRQPQGYTFDGFVLDAVERTLWREGEPVALAPKAVEMLLVLVGQAGRPLSKDELMGEVWPDTFVEEANLAVHISMLRKALGERPAGGLYIETLPRRGYRFAALVREMDSAATRSAAATPVPPPTAPPPPEAGATAHAFVSRLTKHKFVLIAALTVAALAAVVYVLIPRRAPARSGGGIQKLAVLPFVNRGPEGQPYDYGLALADSVINKLGTVSALIVRPTPYVERYAGTNVEPEQAARELDVNYLLMGSYIVDGDEIMVDAKLIDVESRAQLWGEATKRKTGKMTELQEYVAQQVVKGLRVQLSAREDERISRSTPVDPRAYANFAKSRYLMSGNNHREAIRLLDEAVKIDPNFALAWTFLARAYHINALQVSGDRNELLQAEADYQQALDLDPQEPQTRLMYAKLLTETGRVEASAPLLLGLIKDQPNLGEAHWELSYAYRYAGLLSESVAEGERALQLDSRLQSHQFNSYLYSGQYEKFLSSLPTTETAYVTFYRGLAYVYLNDPQRAAAAFDRAYDLNGESVITQIGKAMRLAIAERRAEGLALLEKAEAKITRTGIGDGEIAYKFAQAYDALGHTRPALQALSRSLEQGFFCYPYLASDPLLKNVRGQAEFAALLERARQRHEAFKRRIADLTAAQS